MEARPDQVLDHARERFELRDYFACVHLLDELIASGQAYADAHQLRGLSLFLIGRADDALTALDKALSLNPRYHEAHVNRGLILNELGRSEEAGQAFERARECGGTSRGGIPQHHAAKLANKHAELGDAYAEIGALHPAIEQYRTALRLGPTFHDLRYKLSKLMLEAGRSLEAREELETLVAARPKMLDAKLSLGLACYVSGDRASARTIWTDLGREHGEDIRVRSYLAMLKRSDESRSA